MGSSNSSRDKETNRPHLCFAVGTRVMARLGEIEYFPGTIVEQWVQTPNSPEPLPYLIVLDKDKKEEELTKAFPK